MTSSAAECLRCNDSVVTIASSRVGDMEENPWFSLRYLDVRKMMVIPREVILIFILLA